MFIKPFILKFLNLLVQVSTEEDKFVENLVPTVKLSMMIAPLLVVFDKIVSWTIDNQDYMLFVLGAILIDWVFGTVKHRIEKSFNWGDNAKGLVVKIALAVGGGFLFEGVTYLVGESLISDTLKAITRAIVFLYPAISAWKNMNILSGGEFPPKIWLKKVDKVYDNMDIKHFKKTDQNEEAGN